MPNVIRFIITVVFGFLWWWVYNRVGASLAWLMVLGSILAVCVCCCHDREPGGEWAAGQWSYQGWLACIRRCLLKTAVLIVSLFVLAVLVVWYSTGMAPTAAELAHILLAAIFAPLF